MQALLRVLSAGRDVAEMGSAFGETAAVMAETARSVVTVERDTERVAIARERLAGIPNVELLEGDSLEQLRGRGRSRRRSGTRSSRWSSQVESS